jgi:DNA repair and recombination protein RAD54 and RAD54-like protein
VGLNLVGANRIILVDADWNPASDIQAMGRVFRQGQKKQSFIYRMFTSGTVEEIICQRQIQKGGLVSMTVDADNQYDGCKSKSAQSTQSKFSAEEIRDCFTLKEGCDSDTKRKVGSKWHDYNDKDDLVQQGCVDPVLLEVAAKDPSKATLSYVHVVTEEDADIDDGEAENESMEDDDEKSGDNNDSDDEEEFEFDE